MCVCLLCVYMCVPLTHATQTCVFTHKCSGRKEERVAAASVLEGPKEIPSIDKAQIIADCKEVRDAHTHTFPLTHADTLLLSISLSLSVCVCLCFSLPR